MRWAVSATGVHTLVVLEIHKSLASHAGLPWAMWHLSECSTSASSCLKESFWGWGNC